MSWKKYQKKVQFKRWLKRGIVVVGLVLLVLAAFLAYRGWGWLNSSQPSSQFSYGFINWDVRDQLNLWLPASSAGKPPESLLVALDAKNETLRYRGIQNIQESRIPVDAYLLLDSNIQPPRLDVGFRKLIGARSNLSRRQLIRLWWELRGLDENDITRTDDFSEAVIKAERLKVEVLNGSDRPGLAARSAEVIEAVGGEVIAIGNADGSTKSQVPNPKNAIRAYNVGENSRTVERLTQIFNAEVVHVSIDEPKRADLVLVVKR